MNKLDILEPHNSNILTEYFNGKRPQLSLPTQTKYINYFIKLEDMLYEYAKSNNIMKNIKSIIKMLKDSDLKVETIKQMLQLLNAITPSKSLKNAIEIYSKKTNDYYKNKTTDTLADTKITYNDLKSLLTRKDIDDNDYVLFYILLNYGVRNMDLVIDLQEHTDTNNYMLVNDKSIRYVRNSYKTFAKYGTLKISIKTPRFVKIIKSYVYSKRQALFINNKKDAVQSDDMTNFINTRFNKYLKSGERISESLTYKIINNHYSKSNDTSKQIKISKSRGHDLNTQAKFYE